MKGLKKQFTVRRVFNVSISLLILFLLTQSTLLSKELVPRKVSVRIASVYSSDEKPDKNANIEIIKILQQLVNDVVFKKDVTKLTQFVEKDKGIYLDLKGLWTYDELLNEMKANDSYFQIYFFDHEKLEKQKDSKKVRTVRESLILSEGLEAELFFEGDNACEVKLKFKNNQEFQYDLNNPYFIKVNGKWYIYRLF